MNSSKIDVVVTYVDFNDPKWQKEKANYDSTFEYSEANTEQRFRTIPFFHHWFRALEENAPWVNKVFFITFGHVPEWLNLNHPKLRVVTHKEFIPEKYLPTYNSNVIELNLHRIEDLGEHFILFNDDMFFNAPLTPEDFFVDGKVKDLAIYAPFIPREEFQHIELNNVIVINKYFEPKKTFKKNLFKFFTPAYGKYNMN
ncbi:TPA: capsular biosynthesis protein, partial [Streptococcus suis]